MNTHTKILNKIFQIKSSKALIHTCMHAHTHTYAPLPSEIYLKTARLVQYFKIKYHRTFLVVQWLRLYASNAGIQGAWVRSLVRELRSHTLGGEGQKNKSANGVWLIFFSLCYPPRSHISFVIIS